MWECMVLTFKVLVGGILWSIIFVIVGLIVAGIHKGWVDYNNPPPPEKPKYEGQKIVIDGGKKKDG
jgi:hypothetical protein